MKYFIQLKTLFKYFSITKSIGLFSKISFFWLADFGLPLRKMKGKLSHLKIFIKMKDVL